MDKKIILIKAYSISIILLIVALAVIFRIIQIQNAKSSDVYRDFAEKNNFRFKEIEAARGNLYSSDGVLLSTTILKYDIFIDFKTIKKDIFKDNITALSDSLAKILPKSSRQIQFEFQKQREKGNQYYRLFSNLNYNEFDRIKKFPIFNRGKNKGGFIIDKKPHRVRPIFGFGERTLGFDDSRGKAGIEGGVSEYLKGINGKRFEQKITTNEWKPIDNVNTEFKEPIDGNDVVSTIDMRVQDITFNALKNQLIKYEAEHGCAVVMEVKTGKILAMANLQTDGKGNYSDKRNFAVWEAAEPGSTFKTVSILAALDDGYINPKSVINVGEGVWKFYGKNIRDDETVFNNGNYTITDILAHSSNVGTARIIQNYYGKSPENFIRKIDSWLLNKKVDIPIPGESLPYFPSENAIQKSKITLPWMSFGYGIKITPLQILNFYNAIANNGVMVKPRIIERIESKGKIIKNFKTEIIHKQIASQKAREQLIKMLTTAVEEGTSKSIFTPNLSMAGKTGTTQMEYWKGVKGKYKASFCGFFPAENPKYSCIVVIHHPNPKKSIYGGTVAAPIFKEIAGKVFLKSPLNLPKEIKNLPNFHVNRNFKRTINLNLNENSKFLPNLIGHYGKEIIPQLENIGIRVKYNGNGKIIKQSLPEGFKLKKGITIYLELA